MGLMHKSGAGERRARIIHKLGPAERIWDDITSYASRAAGGNM